MALSHRRRAGKRPLAGALGRATGAPAAVLSVALVALVALVASPARADTREGFSDDTVIAFVGGGAIGADLMFLFYDGALLFAKKHAAPGWAITQTVVTVPQALAFGAMAVAGELKEKQDLLIPGYLGSMLTGAMATHGIWSLANDRVDPLELVAVSPVIAGNTVLTAAALVKATAGELGSPTLAIMELTLAGPSGGYFIYRSAIEENRGGWIGLSVWSGVMVLHGAASLFAWRADEIDTSARLRLPKLPFTIQGFGPSVVSDGFASVPGVQIAGSF